MNSQRRFAPKGGRIESESVACFIGISKLQYNMDIDNMLLQFNQYKAAIINIFYIKFLCFFNSIS